MKTLRIFRFLLMISMVFATFTAATPTYADKHYQTVTYVDDTSILLGNENPCGFDIEQHLFGIDRFNYWLDETGRITRVIDTMGSIWLTFSANGKTVPVMYKGPYTFTSETENEITYRFPATILLVTVPGYGKILGGMGLIVEKYIYDPLTEEWILTEYKEAGNIDLEDWGPFCEYMGP